MRRSGAFNAPHIVENKQPTRALSFEYFLLELKFFSQNVENNDLNSIKNLLKKSSDKIVWKLRLSKIQTLKNESKTISSQFELFKGRDWQNQEKLNELASYYKSHILNLEDLENVYMKASNLLKTQHQTEWKM